MPQDPTTHATTLTAVGELIAALNANSAAARHLELYPDACTSGVLRQIAQWARDFKPGSQETDRRLLESVAIQLVRWAADSKCGGWSTHQAEPQQRLALRIFEHLYGEEPPRPG